MKLLEKFRKFKTHPASRQKAFLKAVFTLLISQLAIKTLTFKRVLKHLESSIRVEASSLDQKTLIEDTLWAVKTAGTLVPGGSACLPQSVSFLYLLRKHPVPAKLMIGVQKDKKDAFAAHAWVELDGLAILGEKVSMDYQEVFAVGA